MEDKKWEVLKPPELKIESLKLLINDEVIKKPEIKTKVNKFDLSTPTNSMEQHMDMAELEEALSEVLLDGEKNPEFTPHQRVPSANKNPEETNDEDIELSAPLNIYIKVIETHTISAGTATENLRPPTNDTINPNIIVTVRVPSQIEKRVEISWDAVYGADSYIVYNVFQDTNGTKRYVELTEVSTNKWDTGFLKHGNLYRFAVKTVINGKKSGYSPEGLFGNYYRIYQSERPPGLEANGSLARDMYYYDKNDAAMHDIAIEVYRDIDAEVEDQSFYDIIRLINGEFTSFTQHTISPLRIFKIESIEGIETLAQSLVDFGPTSDEDLVMRSVAVDMFNHFFAGSGIPYSSSSLSTEIFNNSKIKSSFMKIKNEILTFISNYDGNLTTLPPRTSPSANGDDAKEKRLIITVNGTWGNYVDLIDYINDSNGITGKLKVVVYDHFGLDDADIVNEFSMSDGKKYAIEALKNSPPFLAWYILQRYNGFPEVRYRPFITYMENDYENDTDYHIDIPR